MESFKKNELQIKGIGIGHGRVGGVLHFFAPSSPKSPSHAPLSPALERRRLQAAVGATLAKCKRLEEQALESVGQREAEIFEVHAMLLQDEDLQEAIENGVLQGLSAEDAVRTASLRHQQILSALNDPYLSARAADIQDVTNRLLQELSGASPTDLLPEHPFILVAKDLTPSQTLTLPKERLLGLVTFGGSPGSHTAILARAMGIPALVGVGAVRAELDGSFAILDASAGSLTVPSDEESRTAFFKQHQAEAQMEHARESRLRALIGRPALTKSGKRILVYANVGNEAEASVALQNGAEGIGLLRSELSYLSRDRYPTEDELFVFYDAMAKRMREKPLIVRTLDVGADKKIDYFDLPEEENPALGVRGVRLCLARPKLFSCQLRAILRASASKTVALMLPMIVSAEEVDACRRLINLCMEELSERGVAFDPDLKLGVMIETPAAAVMCEELAERVDFFSVGTNDLTQYTLAADRQNPLLTELSVKNEEPILRLTEAAARAIHARGGWIGVCGELAADPRLTQRFADMGIDELSVAPSSLLEIRQKITECN